MENDNYKGDPFLRDSWEWKAERERTGRIDMDDTPLILREKLVKAKGVFDKIKKLGKESGDDQITEDLKKLEEAILEYYLSVVALSKKTIKIENHKEIERSDERRKIVHDNLYDTINRLSRKFREEGIDNSWRGVIGSGTAGPDDREQVGVWAIDVGQAIIETREAERKASFGESKAA